MRILFFSLMSSPPDTATLFFKIPRLRQHIRWKLWNWWRSSRPVRGPTSLVHMHTGPEYTRLVLRNPSEVVARGGMLVYISAPGLLDTIEAHPMCVAQRGAPPCPWRTTCDDDGVFTICEDSKRSGIIAQRSLLFLRLRLAAIFFLFLREIHLR